MQSIALLLIVLGLIPAMTYAATTSPSTQPSDLRVVSFNIRCNVIFDGRDAWPHRREAFVANVRALDPDLLGLQEVLPDQQAAMTKDLAADYASVSAGRDDGKGMGEACSIFYRKSRFELLSDGTFWLSDTPDKPGSKGWDAALPRICTWARLKDNITRREVLFVNTHFDHVGKLARLNAAKLLVSRLKELAEGRPIILAGDFNATEDTDAYAALVQGQGNAEAPPLRDAYRTAHPERQADEASFHGFKGGVTGSRIDWILHSADLTTVHAEIDRTRSAAGRYPSDHYAILAVLR